MHTLAEPPVEPADLHKAPTVQLNSSFNHIHHALADDQEPQSGPIGPSMPPAADCEVAATSEGDPTGPSAYDDDDANQPTLGRTHCQTPTSTTVQRLACIPSFIAAESPCSLHVCLQCVFRPKSLDEYLCCCYHWPSSVP